MKEKILNFFTNRTVWKAGIFLILSVLVALFLDPVTKQVSLQFDWFFIDGYALVTDRVLLITLLAVLWYTWETLRLKEVSREALLYDQRPILAVYVRNGEEIKSGIGSAPKDYYFLRVCNIGKGVALNIDISFSDKSYLGVLEGYARVLPPNDEKTVKFIEGTRDKTHPEVFSWTDLSNKVFTMQIDCLDAEGRRLTPTIHRIEGTQNTNVYRVTTEKIGKT